MICKMTPNTIIKQVLYKSLFNHCLLLVVWLSAAPIAAQQIIDEDLRGLFEVNQEQTDYSAPLKKASNEFEFILGGGFLIYKTFLSSQDVPSCVFTPSCSVYAVDAFTKKGVIRGWLYTFDRLSRCHPLVKSHHYHFDQNIKRFYDPVD